MVRAIGYIRVSSDEQVKNFSLDNQEQYIRRECSNRGWELVKIFRDEGESAKTLNRKGLIDCLKYVNDSKNKINTFCVYRLDRLSRETGDYLAVRKILSQHQIELFSCNEPLGGSSPADKFIETVLAAAAQLDNEIRACRAQDGMKSRFMSGWANGKAPLGYRSVTNEAGKLIHEPDPDLFPKLQQAWYIMATGTKTLRNMMVYFDEHDIVCSRNKDDAPMETIRRIFSNKYYAGFLRSKKWGEKKGNHLAMVDEEMFYRVQSILSGRKNPTVKRIVERDDFPLRRVVKCDACGLGLTGAWSKGRQKAYAYYFCTCRQKPSIPVSRLHEAMESFLRSITPSPRLLKYFNYVIEEEYNKRFGKIEYNKELAEKKIKELEEMRITIAKNHAKGMYPDSVYKEMDGNIETELIERRIVFNECRIDGFEIETAKNFLTAFMGDLVKAFNLSDAGQKRFLLGSISPDGLVFENGSIRTKAISPLFSFVSEPEKLLSGSNGFSFEQLITSIRDLMLAYPKYQFSPVLA